MACFTQLVPLIESRARVYFTDESMFTSKQTEVKTWMLPGDAMTGSVRNQLGFKAVAVCSFEDVNGRVVSTYTTEQSIDRIKFLEALRAFFRLISTRRPSWLVLDNLRVHQGDEVRDFCLQNKCTLIFQGTYSSEFMPIERLWSFAKRNFSRASITVDNYKDVEAVRALVEQSIASVNRQHLWKHI